MTVRRRLPGTQTVTTLFHFAMVSRIMIMNSDTFRKLYLAKISILTSLILFAYSPIFAWMVDRWIATDTYYSHGFVVPLISAFIVWRNLKKMNRVEIVPSKLGWLFFIPGILIYAISAFLHVFFSSGFALIVILIGLVLLFFGKNFLKQLLFPIFFLSLMIPLPMFATSDISFKLRIFSTHMAMLFINTLGIPAVREGSVIKTMHSYILVEDQCSGIRALIALVALGALVSYFGKMSRKKKIILFLFSIPIALLSNIIRIVALSFVSEIYGAETAMGVFHSAAGFFAFVFAFLGFLLVSKLLE